MKKAVIVIILVSVFFASFNANAGNFKYRYPTEIGAEYSISCLTTGFYNAHVSHSYTGKYIGPVSSVGFNCFGLYASIAGSSRYTGYDVLGYSVLQNFTWYRFGFKVLNFEMGYNENMYLSLTPFYSYGWTGIADTSGNKIGWTDWLEDLQKNTAQQKNTIGVKIDFGFALGYYKLLTINVGLIASLEEIGLGISLNFNTRSLY